MVLRLASCEELGWTGKEYRRTGIVMTHALRLSSIFSAAFMLTHSAALYCEQSAVSC